MTNIVNGIISIIILTMFIGGLAISIWENTRSVAFSLIVVGVLCAFYVDVWQTLQPNIKKWKESRGR